MAFHIVCLIHILNSGQLLRYFIQPSYVQIAITKPTSYGSIVLIRRSRKIVQTFSSLKNNVLQNALGNITKFIIAVPLKVHHTSTFRPYDSTWKIVVFPREGPSRSMVFIKPVEKALLKSSDEVSSCHVQGNSFMALFVPSVHVS